MKIVGLSICGAGEADRYMEKTLKEFKRLCDHVIVATNNATDKEKKLIKKYGFEQYEDNREWGHCQDKMKTDLLAKVKEADWILPIDMDEVFAPEVTRETLERLASTEEIGWYFMIVNLCDDEDHFAHGSGIKRFWNVRFYKYMPELGLTFQGKRLHCGLGPPYAYKFGWYAPYYIEHRGLMTKEDRMRKSERYKKYDPNARFIDKRYYNDLDRELKPLPFNRKKLLEQLASEKTCQLRITPKPYLKVDKPKTPNTLINGNIIKI
jgi:hypothetical protein